ncbi:hypothetical protein [Rhodococcus qingshengii]|uniref:hypothetical protein n=1 Tax=Rhodococcus qingshengii TaxID=334542 RepID=UPI001AE07405|nr:hypothetical protein [Rhodococcus qingshengii]
MILVGSDGERITLGEEESGGGGILVPSPGPPGKDSTVPGPAGRSVDGISVSGDSLVFDMSQGPDITLPVPAVAEATEAAGRAEEAAELSVRTAAGIQDVAEDAAQVAEDRLAVESAASSVAIDRQTVTDALDVVVTAKGDVEQIQTDLHQTKTSIENTATLVDQTLEQYGAQFVAERELSQKAATDATTQAQRAEDAAEGIIAGSVLDNAVTTPKIFDEAVTKAKTSPGVQTSLDKADTSVQEGDSRLTNARPPTAHSHAVADVTGLQSALDGKAPTTHTHAEGQITGLAAKLATKADLDGTGKILAAQIPTEARASFRGVAYSEAGMIALGGERGDWCTRGDRGTDFRLIVNPASVPTNWLEATYPASPVLSVNGRKGAVDTSTADITDATAVGRASMRAVDQAAGRAAIGAGTGNSNLALGTTSVTARRGDLDQIVTALPTTGQITGAIYHVTE